MAPGPKLPATLCTSAFFSDRRPGDASSTATRGMDEGPRLSKRSACSSGLRPRTENYFGAAFQLCGVADGMSRVGPVSSVLQESCPLPGPDDQSQRREAGAPRASQVAAHQPRSLGQLTCLCLVLGADPAPHAAPIRALCLTFPLWTGSEG